MIVKDFGTGTRGFAAPEDSATAVCLLPGTELSFDAPVEYRETNWARGIYRGESNIVDCQVARFRQVEKEQQLTHHDALEFGQGQLVKLTWLEAGQTATVLQLPAEPKSAQEAKDQERLAVVA